MPLPPVILLPARPAPAAAVTARFHVPFEHGAWWSYFSTLAASFGVALYRGADAWACAGLLFSLSAGFVAQDWGQALLAALLRRRSQALSQWRAWQGWALALASAAGAALLLWRQPAALRPGWAALLAALGLAATLGLLLRIVQSGRGRRSLAAAALLLASPALPFGFLAFDGAGAALLFWAWPLAYYPAATLAAQSFIRGFPERARWAGPALAAALAGLAAGAAAWAGAGLLLLQALRLQGAIRARWQAQPEGLPPGGAIRAFGKEQAFLGVSLTLLWALAFSRL
jgi:hypothetical protein